MKVHIVDDNSNPIPNVSVFTSDENGNMVEGFKLIADEDGAFDVPDTPCNYITFRSVGMVTATYEPPLPGVIEMETDYNSLPAVQITANQTSPVQSTPTNSYWTPIIIATAIIIGTFVIIKLLK